MSVNNNVDNSDSEKSSVLDSPTRRSSVRNLSKSVTQTLRQLQKDEHNARVAQFVSRANARFYSRQQLCESISTFLILTSFTGLSVYLVLAHGFQHFHTANFTIVYQTPSNLSLEGKQVELMCRTDSHWEWCRWVHMKRYCEWEWLSPEEGVVETSCNMENVQLIGDYDSHECGIRFEVSREHEGEWLCEIERYHYGFSRRYGEVRYSHIILSVIENNTKDKLDESEEQQLDADEGPHNPTTTPAPSTTRPPTTEDSGVVIEKQAYEKRFFILKVVVRSSVLLTLLGLCSMFGVLFLRSWKAWEQYSQSVPKVSKLVEEDPDEENETYPEMDPALMLRLQQNKRKSVAFSVCVVDRDNMTLEFDRKKVSLPSVDRLGSFKKLPVLEEEKETERVKVPIYLSSAKKKPKDEANQNRRMSMPIGLLSEDGETDSVKNILKLKKLGNSRETIM